MIKVAIKNYNDYPKAVREAIIENIAESFDDPAEEACMFEAMLTYDMTLDSNVTELFYYYFQECDSVQRDEVLYLAKKDLVEIQNYITQSDVVDTEKIRGYI